jgi:hypothetical protein
MSAFGVKADVPRSTPKSLLLVIYRRNGICGKSAIIENVVCEKSSDTTHVADWYPGDQ